MSQNYGLGRGLSSLIPQKNKKISEPESGFNYFGSAKKEVDDGSNLLPDNSSKLLEDHEIEISRISPNPHQPRLYFDEIKLQELAESIKEHGIIQPIVVSENKDNFFEIIAGERRFQAAKLAGLLKVPVIIRKATEQQKLELAIIENVQRHDLNPIEEAKSFRNLMEEFDLSQEEAAKKIGTSRSAFANKLRMLNLPVEMQKALMEEKITEGHARAILAISDYEKQKALFNLILKNGLTVRQTESKTKEVFVRTHNRKISLDSEIKTLEEHLAQALNTKVKLQKTGESGRIIIEFYSEEELQNIIKNIDKK